MTDAREIIEATLRGLFKKVWPKQSWGSAIIADLEAAGFRILGPDEVDLVTLEKAADAAEERAEWVPLKADDMRDAILSIGRRP